MFLFTVGKYRLCILYVIRTGNIYNLQRTFQNSLTRFLQRLMGLVGGTYWHWPVLSARSGASGKKSRPWPITTTKQSSLGEAWQMVLQ